MVADLDDEIERWSARLFTHVYGRAYDRLMTVLSSSSSIRIQFLDLIPSSIRSLNQVPSSKIFTPIIAPVLILKQRAVRLYALQLRPDLRSHFQYVLHYLPTDLNPVLSSQILQDSVHDMGCDVIWNLTNDIRQIESQIDLHMVTLREQFLDSRCGMLQTCIERALHTIVQDRSTLNRIDSLLPAIDLFDFVLEKDYAGYVAWLLYQQGMRTQSINNISQ
jgi:hypothetical protein